MGEAHAQDFERKRRPITAEPASPYHGARTIDDVSSDDEDEEGEIVAEPEDIEGGEDGEEGTRVRQEVEEDIQSAQEILRRHKSATDPR